MALTATAFGGATANSNAADLNPGSLTSATGDRVVVVYTWFDTGTAASQAAGRVTSTPAKTFTKDAEFLSGSMGFAVYSWVSDGTTLTQINVAPTAGSSVGNVAGGTVKVHSDAGTVTYDSTTKGTGTDSTSPLAWSAGGAVSGTQIGFIGVVIDNGAAGAFTTSSGYTMLQEHGDGTTSLTNHEAYKVNETGTPSLSVAYSAAITAAAELFVSFKEPGGGTTPVTATRATTWNVRATVTASRATTWVTATAVSATRATTWVTGAAVTSTRATTWNTRSAISATRATTWNTVATVTASRATTWNTRTVVLATRATTWVTATTVTTTRSTTWNVASALTAVTATRATTWVTRAAVTATRSSTWVVASSMVATRATTWTTLASLSTTRATTWVTRQAVAATRATTWNVVAGAVIADPTLVYPVTFVTAPTTNTVTIAATPTLVDLVLSGNRVN
jgi:hypothetical protein